MVAAAAYATLLEALKAEGKFREGSRVAEEMLEAVHSNYARSIAYFQRATALAEMGEDLDAALELRGALAQALAEGDAPVPAGGQGVGPLQEARVRPRRGVPRAARPSSARRRPASRTSASRTSRSETRAPRGRRSGGRSGAAARVRRARRPRGEDARADPAEPPAHREARESGADARARPPLRVHGRRRSGDPGQRGADAAVDAAASRALRRGNAAAMSSIETAPTERRNQPVSLARPNAWNGTTPRPAPRSSAACLRSS